MMPLVDFVRNTKFFAIAHRGASGEAPENTLASIRLAIDGGAKMVEIDVQTTLDNQLVVFHDNVLGRTTSGHGHVKNQTLSEIQQYDAGSWFNSRYSTERVPSLEQALKLFEGKAYLDLEIKPLTADRYALDVMNTAIQSIVEIGMAPYTVFSSFDHHALKLIKEFNSKLHTAALNIPGDNRLPSQVITSCNADAFACSINEMNSKRAEDCAKYGIPWGVYTVNTAEALEKAVSNGVQAVVTNYPKKIMEMYSGSRQ